jgi:protein TonB
MLHVLALALALYTRERPLPPAYDTQSGISMVFDHGGAQQTMAPPAPLHGPPEPAQSPATPPPPPPPPPSAQAEMNLNLPLNALSPLPQPQSQPQPAPKPRPPPPQHYIMMMDGMSYGSPSAVAPAPPAAKRALSLDLPQTDVQAVMGPALTVKGDMGADWDAALNKWVNDHSYYPQAAAEQNQQGSVEIEFTVDRYGNVTKLHMLNGSGSPFLDQAWQGLFQGAQLPPFPPGTKDDHTTVDATMHYEIVP